MMCGFELITIPDEFPCGKAHAPEALNSRSELTVFTARGILENQLQTELNLAADRRPVAQLAKHRRTHCQRRAARGRQEEGGRVGEIEELRPKLQSGSLHQTEILECGKIGIHRSRAATDVSSRVPEKLDRRARIAGNRSRYAERRRIEVLIHSIVRVHVHAGDAVRDVERGNSLRNHSDTNVGGKTAAYDGDPVHLPSAEDRVDDSSPVQEGLAFAERQLIGVAGDEALRDIERAWPVVAPAVVRVKRQRGAAILRIRAVAGAVRLQILGNGGIHQKVEALREALLDLEGDRLVLVV